MQDRWILILERVGRLKPLAIFGWSVIVLVGLALLVVHARIIFYPYQMEYREGAILVTNQAVPFRNEFVETGKQSNLSQCVRVCL